MNIIYYKENGIILMAISKCQDYRKYFEEWGSEFVDSLDYIYVDEPPKQLKYYYIKDGNLVEMTEEEKNDIDRYGKILTDEERLLNKLKPTIEEIQKAEQTIEILTLIQEVM